MTSYKTTNADHNVGSSLWNDILRGALPSGPPALYLSLYRHNPVTILSDRRQLDSCKQFHKCLVCPRFLVLFYAV